MEEALSRDEANDVLYYDDTDEANVEEDDTNQDDEEASLQDEADMQRLPIRSI